MSDLIIRAANLAAQLHAGQTRKASLVPGVPYLSHVMEVAGMVQSAGGSDEAVASAWLHDVLEDTTATAEWLRTVMSESVVALVLECTEPGTDGPVKAPWQERKDAYIAHLYHCSASATLISVADKLQSLLGLKQCVRVQGDEAYRQLVKSAGSLEKQKELTIWLNGSVCFAAGQRLLVLRQTDPQPMLEGLAALLADYSDVINWLEERYPE